MARIALRSRLAAYVSGVFVQPMVRMYEKPVVIATVLWTLYTWWRDGELDHTGIALYAGVIVLVGIRWLAFREAGKLTSRYYDAFARGDADELAELSKLFRALHPDAEERAAYAGSRLGEEMIVRKRWAEAQKALAAVDLAFFPSHSRAVVLNNLAYVTARNGDPNAALEVIARAFVEADKSPTAKMIPALPSLRGTHGIALHLAGRHEEALPLLELGVEEGSARSRNERMYWLGRVYRILGREDDARLMFTRAIELGGPSTEDARAALAEGTPFRG